MMSTLGLLYLEVKEAIRVQLITCETFVHGISDGRDAEGVQFAW